jgi:hypothetical protein
MEKMVWKPRNAVMVQSETIEEAMKGVREAEAELEAAVAHGEVGASDASYLRELVRSAKQNCVVAAKSLRDNDPLPIEMLGSARGAPEYVRAELRRGRRPCSPATRAQIERDARQRRLRLMEIQQRVDEDAFAFARAG